MNRKNFLKTLALFPLAGSIMNLNEFHTQSKLFSKTDKMPMLFLGHGSPMNAIEENQFVQEFRQQATLLPKPNAILCISAHCYTKGTFVTAMEQPKTIHDFGGFPKELYEVEYPALGSPMLAAETIRLANASIKEDLNWGLDHGAWSVIKHLYPKADIPVVQLSLDYTQSSEYHFKLGKMLSELRHRGVLIIGSGNIIHNLRLVDFNALDKIGYGFDWAIEAHATINQLLHKGDFNALVSYQKLGKSVQLAVPSPDHYLPLLYILALKDDKDSLSLFNDKLLAGSLSMTSVKIET